MIAYIIVLLIYPVTYQLFRTHDGRKALALMGITAGISGIFIPSGSWLSSQIASFTKLPAIDLSGINRAMPMKNCANMIFYFILGAFVYEYRGFIEKKLNGKTYISIVAILSGSLGLMAIKYLDTGTWRWANIYLSNGYHRVLTIILSLGMFLFFEWHHSNIVCRFLAKYIGQMTLGIYYMHVLFLIICEKYLYPSLTNYYSFTLNCVKTIVITTICVALTYIMKKIPIIRLLV